MLEKRERGRESLHLVFLCLALPSGERWEPFIHYYTFSNLRFSFDLFPIQWCFHVISFILDEHSFCVLNPFYFLSLICNIFQNMEAATAVQRFHYSPSSWIDWRNFEGKPRGSLRYSHRTKENKRLTVIALSHLQPDKRSDLRQRSVSDKNSSGSDK